MFERPSTANWEGVERAKEWEGSKEHSYMVLKGRESQYVINQDKTTERIPKDERRM